jgi:hypothetical protein
VNAVGTLGLAVVVPMLLAGAASIPLSITTSRPAELAAEPAPATGRVEFPLEQQEIVTDSRQRRSPRPEPGGTIDLYGNEVANAVAEYTLDPGGSLYELHSPQTELPHLGSPKS